MKLDFLQVICEIKEGHNELRKIKSKSFHPTLAFGYALTVKLSKLLFERFYLKMIVHSIK